MLTVQVNDAGLKRKMRTISRAFGPSYMKRVMRGVGEKLLRDIDQNFKSQGAFLAHGWAPLRPSTIRRRLNKSKGSIKILQDTGRLRQSFTFRRVSDRLVTVGTADVRAPRLQRGDPSRHLVGRRMIHNKQQAKEAAVKLMDALIKRGIGRGQG